MTGPAELSLRAYQETALRVFFSREPSEDDLVALGSPERFGCTASMVRHRLDKVVRAALPRTLQALGRRRSERAHHGLLRRGPAAHALVPRGARALRGVRARALRRQQPRPPA
jgi:hypothetical protein